jgi:hypothetical protein
MASELSRSLIKLPSFVVKLSHAVAIPASVLSTHASYGFQYLLTIRISVCKIICMSRVLNGRLSFKATWIIISLKQINPHSEYCDEFGGTSDMNVATQRSGTDLEFPTQRFSKYTVQI